VASAVLTPELALRYLAELSIDIRASALLSPDGSLAASDPPDRELGEALAEQVAFALAAADRGATEPVAEVEATMAAGSVFVVRRAGRALAVVTRRYALSSLVRYDLRQVLADLVEEDA